MISSMAARADVRSLTAMSCGQWNLSGVAFARGSPTNSTGSPSRLGGGRGHRTFAGTPEQVADTIQEWFESGAADGFNVMPAALPSGLEAFAEHVIPIFRKRGLFRTEYTGQTLRDHYGIPRPDSQFAQPGAQPPEPVV